MKVYVVSNRKGFTTEVIHVDEYLKCIDIINKFASHRLLKVNSVEFLNSRRWSFVLSDDNKFYIQAFEVQTYGDK